MARSSPDRCGSLTHLLKLLLELRPLIFGQHLRDVLANALNELANLLHPLALIEALQFLPHAFEIGSHLLQDRIDLGLLLVAKPQRADGIADALQHHARPLAAAATATVETGSIAASWPRRRQSLAQTIDAAAAVKTNPAAQPSGFINDLQSIQLYHQQIIAPSQALASLARMSLPKPKFDAKTVALLSLRPTDQQE